ncbi:MAG: cupin domain-containing protein [Patescibacteria group bacterium]|jgi:uncharacterized RmlC-like cupin family protein
MQIISRSDGISVEKKEGTKVIYHIFHEFEIHYNEVPAGTTQAWHHHDVIEEVLYILSGELEAYWKEKNKTFKQTVKVGDVVRVENTPHTFINSSSGPAVFVVFRFVPDGADKRHIIKNDKHSD